MRKLWIAVFLIGCGSSSPTRPEPLVDGGVDGGGGLDGGSCVNTVQEAPLEPWAHIPEGQQPVYLNNPPVSGEHYELTWARWQIHPQTVPRAYWVHNLEHGGVAFLYNPDAGTDVVQALTRVYNAIPIGVADGGCETHRRAVLTPDPLLNAPWAVTVSGPVAEGKGYYIKDNCINESTLVNFAVQRRGRGAVEDLCTAGNYPP